uniref:ZP domain-containing protein n=1 Tax=Tetranychus urticae TaxID=32264 RepID=T1KS31_TETUR
MYSIYVLILVSTFGSSIYCQSCFYTTTACAIPSICCVRLSIPKSIPRTGGLVRIIPNFPVDTDIKNRPGDFILRFQSTIYESSATLKFNFTNNFVCNNISIFISTWTCDIIKQYDSKLNVKEQIEIVEIYARDPGITYAPDYTFPGQKGIIKVQFTYCPNEYFTDYTKFTLNNKNLGHEVDKKHVFFGSLCTFLLTMSGDSAGASFMTVIIKINNRPLATNMTIYIRETPSFEATEWITFQKRPLNLPLRGKNFDSLYQPHYQLFTSKGVKNVTVFESFLTPCRVVNSTLMQCAPLIIEAPVILFARFSMETDIILEIFHDYIVPSYSRPVVHIVLIKQNVTLLKKKCVDVFLKPDSNKMTCLLNETVNKKFQWWVEMTVDNYTLDRYCLVACDTNLWKAKRQPVERYKSKLHGNTLAHPKTLSKHGIATGIDPDSIEET